MNEMKNNFKNKFVSNSFINQSLIDEYYITNSDGITECNVEITGIHPTSYPAHLVRPTPLTENIIAFPISNGVFHVVHEQLKHFPDCNPSMNESKLDTDSSSSNTNQTPSDTEFSRDSMINKRTQSSLGESYMQCVEESIHVKFDEESYTNEKVTHSPSIFQKLLFCPFDEEPSAGDKTDSSDSIIPVPCSLNQDTTATSADNSLGADETLEAEDSPETDNVSVSNSPESASVTEHRDHPVDRIIGNIHDGVQSRSSVLNNFCITLKYSPMAASLFTYSSTSRRVVPAPNSPPLPIHIKSTNVVFNPDIPEIHRGLGLDDFVNFLASCCLRYALSDVPSEFFPEQVCEFYYTATVNEDNNAITGTIGHGRHSVFITTKLLSAALRLPIFEPFSEPPTIERCKRMFDQLGYDHSKAGTRSALILRQCMTPGWKFFTGALYKCVGHKSRSGDQLSTYEQQGVCSLLLNKILDYGALFFDQLVQLLRANVRANHVPFPRWIALVFDKFFAEYYFSHSGNPIQCPRMSVRMYQDDLLDTNIGISDRMREWIVNPYTVPSLTADTDEGGAEGNHVDHADQEVEHHDGGHFSPQLSHHIILDTDKASSTPKDSMNQGEQPSQGEHPSPAAQHSSPRMPPSSPVSPVTSVVQIPTSTFSELMTLTRDMSQRLLRIEGDVQQIKEVFLLTSPSSPKSEDAQKGGDSDDDADADDHADGEPNEKDTIIQHNSPTPIPESDSVGHNSPAATEKLIEDSEHDEEHDEPDDECQILDMNFINPLVPVQQESSDDLEKSHLISADLTADPIFPVQGEDSDVASEESHSPSRKRKHKLQAKGSFEAQMQKFLEFQSKAQSSQPPPGPS
ncbi:unnamed protein product [Lactuca saligna]|uniref:Uncharacterized protein n=1 Tax=Lactuca saligna TaxID=75948 RepID=A0AA36EFN3_LACSI|nr:unnamed protein product [Lactuca saligna]